MTTGSANETIFDAISEALVSFGVEREDISSDASLEALDIDSLDLAELAQIIEERYSVQITGADVAELKTVGDVVALIESRA